MDYQCLPHLPKHRYGTVVSTVMHFITCYLCILYGLYRYRMSFIRPTLETRRMIKKNSKSKFGQIYSMYSRIENILTFSPGPLTKRSVVQVRSIDTKIQRLKISRGCPFNEVFTASRWAKFCTVWRGTCPAWPLASTVAASSKFTGNFQVLCTSRIVMFETPQILMIADPNPVK